MKFLFRFVYGWYRQLIRHPRARWWVALATVGYLILPTDFLPDLMPVLGQIDDVAIASILIAETAPMVLEQLKKRKKTSTTANS